MKNNVNNEGMKKEIFNILMKYPLSIDAGDRSEIAEVLIPVVCQHYRERLIEGFKTVKYDSFNELRYTGGTLKKIERIINEVMSD